jgi:serine phosphatase RsbU (regulator of sigma subunit)
MNNKVLLLRKQLFEKQGELLKYETDSSAPLPNNQKLEEKNRKLFQMSEAVYKEKKKVDEELEKLSTEKQKLEVDKKKVDDKVKKLWEQSTAIYKEKERVEKLKEVIELKHNEVTESINYAKRIQNAILPLQSEIDKAFTENFVLFKPRDIVSGDFYWFFSHNDKNLIAAIDCTGHGVPGAFMSMIGHTLINEIVVQLNIVDPGEILNQLDSKLRHVLKQDNSDDSTRDGMDICLCVFDKNLESLMYAGANRPLWLVKKTDNIPFQLNETKATKTAIGGIHEREIKFLTHQIGLEKGDTVYLSTDGFADQFNKEDEKLMTKRFKELILSFQNNSLAEQKRHLDNFHINWRGETEQTDDVLVIGIRRVI